MTLRILAACLVAGSTWSTASADALDNASNPKTRQQAQSVTPAGISAAGVAGRGRGTPRPSPLLALAPPVNDDCSGAIALGGGPGPFVFDTTGATTSAQQGGCGTNATNDIWFSWTAPSSGSVSMSLCSGPATFDSVIKVYVGAGCPVGPALGCNDEYCSHLSQFTFTASMGTTYMLQVGGWTGDFGPGSFTMDAPAPPPPPPANDLCSAATVLAGVGVFPFDNTGATTGLEGQGETQCNWYGSTAVLSDIWFQWTAPSSGQAVLSGCGLGTVDTKIAVYPGVGCPTTGTALDCDDDFCGFPLTSQVSWPCTAGAIYTIQLGLYPFGGALPGAGNFSLDVVAPLASCDALDDGTAENIWSVGGNADTVWLVRFGEPGVTTTIDAVDLMYGSPFFPAATPPNGTPTDVLLYADGLSQDGDPSDATLLVQIPSVVSMHSTDTYVSTPLPSPVTITGYFFAGGHEASAPGLFVAPNDENSIWNGHSWQFGNNAGGAANLANPGANVSPPAQLGALIGGLGNFCVRVQCSFGPTNTFCQPGFGPTLACPCTNPPSGLARGCNNKDGTGGAQLTATGTPSLSAPLATTLVLTDTFQNPIGSQVSILMQGKALTNGAQFGHGVRCFGTFMRVYNKTAVAGTITFPIGADPTIPMRAATAGQPIPVGAPRFYQVYYRDNVNMLPALSCSIASSKQNISDGQWCYWLP